MPKVSKLLFPHQILLQLIFLTESHTSTQPTNLQLFTQTHVIQHIIVELIARKCSNIKALSEFYLFSGSLITKLDYYILSS